MKTKVPLRRLEVWILLSLAIFYLKVMYSEELAIDKCNSAESASESASSESTLSVN